MVNAPDLPWGRERRRTVRRYMCKKVVWDQVLNVGRRARPVSEKKNWRVEEVTLGSGMPMSSPEAVLGGPVPERMAVRCFWGIVYAV